MPQNFRLRPVLQQFKAYVPGRSIEEIREAYGLTQVTKLASNENPLGVSPVVQKAIAQAAARVFRYPQAGNPRLTKAIADTFGLDPQGVVCGNGSDEIIDLLIRAACVPGQSNVVAFKPCFSMYTLQCRLEGVDFRQAPLAQDLSFDFDALLDLCDGETRLVFVTNPDNPSGHWVPTQQLRHLAKRLPEGCLLVVDEAYADFCDEPHTATMLADWGASPNVAVLRTFSKAYGLAGLRLGFGAMPVELAKALLSIRLPFSVNILAEEAGLAALSDTVFLKETQKVTRQGRDYLMAELDALGCAPRPTQANFILFTPPMDPARITERLLQAGIIVRPLASYGMESAIRVSIGRMDENRLFVAALKAILA